MDGVLKEIDDYFKEHLPQYEVIRIDKKLYDDYLYMVAAKKKEVKVFACWTSWNASTGSLNHGHYGLADLARVEQIYEEYCVDYHKPTWRFAQDDCVKIYHKDGTETEGVVCGVRPGAVILDETTAFGDMVDIRFEDIFCVVKGVRGDEQE